MFCTCAGEDRLTRFGGYPCFLAKHSDAPAMPLHEAYHCVYSRHSTSTFLYSPHVTALAQRHSTRYIVVAVVVGVMAVFVTVAQPFARAKCRRDCCIPHVSGRTCIQTCLAPIHQSQFPAQTIAAAHACHTLRGKYQPQACMLAYNELEGYAKRRVGSLVQIDIEFPRMPCAWMSIDAMDISGEV